MTYLLETIKLGLKNLWLHRLRSFLTALGIILGVAAVIIMVSIGEGSKRAALEQIERLGARNIIIRSVKPPESVQAQQGQQQGWQTKYGLTRVDLARIHRFFPHADVIVPVKAVGMQVLKGVNKKTSQAFGTVPELLEVAKLRVARGRYLTAGDMEQRAAVAVIGYEIARTLYPAEDALGQTIQIDQQSFEVVGILQQVGLAGGAGAALIGRDLNQDVHIPMSTARARFGDVVMRQGSGSFSAEEVQVHEVYYRSASRDEVLSDAAVMRRVIQDQHKKMEDIEIIVPFELLEEAKRVALTWQIVLGFVAGISLLVGGIGIMNIMLASVTERTREIGVRRALGATKKAITNQFLVETSVLSAIGGIVGVVFGIVVSLGLGWGAAVLDYGENLSTQITLWSILLSFTVATLTGLVFGIYPARVAARKDPVVALRHD